MACSSGLKRRLERCLKRHRLLDEVRIITTFQTFQNNLRMQAEGGSRRIHGGCRSDTRDHRWARTWRIAISFLAGGKVLGGDRQTRQKIDSAVSDAFDSGCLSLLRSLFVWWRRSRVSETESVGGVNRPSMPNPHDPRCAHIRQKQGGRSAQAGTAFQHGKAYRAAPRPTRTHQLRNTCQEPHNLE